jgi:hypothetical protein
MNGSQEARKECWVMMRLGLKCDLTSQESEMKIISHVDLDKPVYRGRKELVHWFGATRSKIGKRRTFIR